MNHTMWLMARKGDVKTLEYLIASGHSVNTKNSMCETPLHIAASYEQEAAARILLDNGALVNCRNGLSLATPLHLACENNDIKTVSLLLERGADPEMVDKRGDTPLSIVREHNYRIVESLISAANEVIACKLRCGAYILRRLENAHLERDCLQRFVKCRLGCGAEFPVAETHKHESKTCVEAIIDCWNECGVSMRRRQMGRHVKLECPFGAKTKCRFGCSVLRSEQHAHELAHLDRRAITWTEAELGFWMTKVLFDELGDKEGGKGNSTQEFDLLEGTGFTADEAKADAEAQAKEREAEAELERIKQARLKAEAEARGEGDAAGAGAGAGAGSKKPKKKKQAEAKGDDGERAEDGASGSGGGEGDGDDDDGGLMADNRTSLDHTGKQMPQADFLPRLHGVKEPLSDRELLSGRDYTHNLENYKITGRILCLFAANKNAQDSMEWITQRLGMLVNHRRVIIREFFTRIKFDKSLVEAAAAVSIPVGIGNPSVFCIEGETFANKFTVFTPVRNKVLETPGLKWKIPEHYRFVSMHSNLQIDHEKEGSTLVLVHGYMALLQPYNPEDEPAPPP